MKQIPPPSRNTQKSLYEVLISCQQKKMQEAAINLSASAQAATVIPSMTTDFYHLANAAIKLGLEKHINNEELIHVIGIMKSEFIPLRGQRWLGALYQDTIDNDDENYEERYSALEWIDLDHFSTQHLERIGHMLLNEGTRAYENRQPDDALGCFRKVYRIANHLQDKEKIAVCLFEIGFVLHTKGNTEFAVAHYEDAVNILSATKYANSSAFAQYVFHAGRFFELQHDTERANVYFHNALKMFEVSGDSDGVQACREKLR